MQTKIIFRGKRDLIENFLLTVKSIEGVSEANVTTTKHAGEGLLERKPLNQIEIVDLVLSFSISLAANFSYDLIRTRVRDKANDCGFNELNNVEGDNVDDLNGEEE